MYSHNTEVRLTTHNVFGDGNHESTQLVLDALYSLNPANKSILDMGTGTGVQAIFAKKWGATDVLAIDIDASAIYCARDNFKRNNVQVTSFLNIYNEGLDFQADIIIANLPPDNVCEFLKMAQANLKPNGKIIISWLKAFNLANECDLTNYNIVDHIEGFEWDAYILEGKG